MDEPTRLLRFNFFAFYLQHCRPPTIDELVQMSKETPSTISAPQTHSTPSTVLTASDVRSMLEKLDELHHIVLYKSDVQSPTPIAMAHPFSHLPMPYVVIQGNRSWYANCAWCACGLATMLAPAVTTIRILTHRGDLVTLVTVYGDTPAVRVAGGTQKRSDDVYAIFSPVPSTWWNDVRFACGTIQLCLSRQEADEWQTQRGFQKGEMMSLETLWNLSTAWYQDKHKYEYDRKPPEEVKHLYQSLGMTSEYWSS